MNVISRKVASSFHVREDTDERLVLQASWMDSCGCAVVFIAFGAFWLCMLPGTDLGTRILGGAVGWGFCLAGLVAIVMGLMGSNRAILFDHRAREVRFIGMPEEPARIPYDEVAGLEDSALDLTDAEGPLVYYNLFLVTTSGRKVLLCQSRDRKVIGDLARRLEPVARVRTRE